MILYKYDVQKIIESRKKYMSEGQKIIDTVKYGYKENKLTSMLFFTDDGQEEIQTDTGRLAYIEVGLLLTYRDQYLANQFYYDEFSQETDHIQLIEDNKL